MFRRFAALATASTLAAAAFVLSEPSLGARAAEDAQPFANLSWRSLGPAVSGGRLGDVAGTDSDPALYYVGAADGGVWRSTNAGTDWTPVFDKAPVQSIGSVAIAASDKNVVYVGTGEGNPRNDITKGGGVYVTRDGGKTWLAKGLEKTAQIGRMLVDPTNTNVAFACALGDAFRDSPDRGVYRTADGGTTWSRVLGRGPSTGCSDLAWDPQHPGTLFAGLWQYRRNASHLESGGPDGGLFRSTDGGITWAKLAGNGLPEGVTGRIGLAVGRNRPERVYAMIENKAGLLWRSDDGGNAWKLVSKNTLINERPFYYSRIHVDPTNPDHLFSSSVLLAESNDGGVTWKRSGRRLHGDHHAMWIAADGKRIIEGNDGGVGFSADAGATWEWRNQLPLGQAYRIGFDRADTYTVCVGLQDNGTWCAPNDTHASGGNGAEAWQRISGGDGTYVVPDPLDARYVWSSSGGGDNGGELVLHDRTTKQTANVSPILRNQNALAPSTFPYRFNWEAPITFSRDGKTAYYGANVVFATTDRGLSWKPISPDLTRNDKSRQTLSGGPITIDGTGAETSSTILEIAPSTVANGLIWVGTDDGLVQITRDGGANWSNVAIPGVGQDARIATLDASSHDAASAFAVVDKHYTGDDTPYVFTTTDYGKTWKSIATGLPQDQPARAIRQDPKNPDVLYLGLERSIWISFDRGISWRSLQLDMPHVIVRDIRVHADANDLIVGTHGRGIYILDDLAALQKYATAKAPLTLFAPRPATLFAQYNPTIARLYAGQNPAYGATLTYQLSQAAKTAPTLEILDSAGKIVRTIAGASEPDDADEKPAFRVPGAAGMNRVTWNLAYDAPRGWAGAPAWNRGPDAGAPVVPGRYTARLTVDGVRAETPILVRADPRATLNATAYADHLAFVASLDRAIDELDTMLDGLDRTRAEIDVRMPMLKDAAAITEARNLVAAAQALQDAVTTNPRNSQDNDFLVDLVRERLLSLRGTIDDTFDAPRGGQSIEGTALVRLADERAAEYQAYAKRTAAFDRTLARLGIPPLTKKLVVAKPKPTGAQDQNARRGSDDD